MSKWINNNKNTKTVINPGNVSQNTVDTLQAHKIKK